MVVVVDVVDDGDGGGGAAVDARRPSCGWRNAFRQLLPKRPGEGEENGPE